VTHNLTSACAIVIASLNKEDKERLLRELARECGYQLITTTPTPKPDGKLW
jgi:hypothetical protein